MEEEGSLRKSINTPRNTVREDCSKDYDINIKRVDNGFIVNIGCKTFVIVKLDDLLNDLELYYKDFERAKEKYLTKTNG